ncbi:TetR/AcrR family transcriptional regulator [Bacillus sp. JJ722]|uniref:TetR/AcrR family transcriptional regulator n=1 Tax=Bacillus sp. JJ722 TaxID=3122973 RepID=UPI0030008107
MAKPNVVSKLDLIQAAKDCLVEKGIDKFTLRAVADKAGVTQGTIYYHFRTKEQLFLALVQDVCDISWNELSEYSDHVITKAIDSAKSRCSYDSFFHRLFFTLIVSSFTNEKMNQQLGEIIQKENEALSNRLSTLWSTSPIKGISYETWAILINAIVDGLAMQALLSKQFPVEKTYSELEQLLVHLTKQTHSEG